MYWRSINKIIENGNIYGLEINRDIADASVNKFVDNPNIFIFCQDGKNGLLDNAPYDRILWIYACSTYLTLIV